MHYFSVEQIGRYRTMPTTPMALLSALDRNGLRNPDYFRSSTYLFTSNLPLVSTSTSKWYRPTIPCHTFQDWRNNAWLIASSLRFYYYSMRPPNFKTLVSIHSFLFSFSNEEDLRIIDPKSYNNFPFPLNIRFQFSLFIFYPQIHRPNVSKIYIFNNCVYISVSIASHLFLPPLKFFIFTYDTDFERNHAIYVSYNSWADWKISTSEESCAIRRTIGGVLSRSPVVSQSVTWCQPCKHRDDPNLLRNGWMPLMKFQVGPRSDEAGRWTRLARLSRSTSRSSYPVCVSSFFHASNFAHLLFLPRLPPLP